jgi:membrane complex biogenesis BtpA family protein
MSAPAHRPAPAFFDRPARLVGVVHLLPLPGTDGAPAHAADAMRAALELALADARALEVGGFDAIIVENFGDAPFYKDDVPKATVAALARACAEVRRAVALPLGVNVLRNDAGAAIAIAAACGFDFVRVNVHAGAMVTDQGVIEGRAAATLAERRRLGAESVALWADVLVKHADPLAGQRTALLPQVAEDTFRRGHADALIVSGAGTGKSASLDDVAAVKRAVPEARVVVGSGVTLETVRATLAIADAAIVGTWTKADGRVDRPVDVERVRALVSAARS